MKFLIISITTLSIFGPKFCLANTDKNRENLFITNEKLDEQVVFTDPKNQTIIIPKEIILTDSQNSLTRPTDADATNKEIEVVRSKINGLKKPLNILLKSYTSYGLIKEQEDAFLQTLLKLLEDVAGFEKTLLNLSSLDILEKEKTEKIKELLKAINKANKEMKIALNKISTSKTDKKTSVSS